MATIPTLPYATKIEDGARNVRAASTLTGFDQGAAPAHAPVPGSPLDVLVNPPAVPSAPVARPPHADALDALIDALPDRPAQGGSDDALTALIDALPDTAESGYDQTEESDARLEFLIRHTAAWDADRHARALEIANETGLESRMVESNLDNWARRLKTDRFDAAKFRRENPQIAAWLLEDPVRAVATQDDLDNLSGIEWLLMAGHRALDKGARQVELALIRTAEMWGLAPEWARKRAQAQSDSMYRGDYGSPGILGRSITGSLEQVPNIVFNVAGRAGGGLIGAAVGAIAGGGTPAEAGTLPAGVVVGQQLGGIGAAYTLEAGLAYDEMLQMRDEQGQPLDPAIARNVANAVGLANAGLEALSISTLLTILPGGRYLKGRVTRTLGEQAARKTVAAAAGRYAKNTAKAVGTEVVTETLQESVNIAGEQLGQAVSGQPFEPVTLDEIQQRLAGIIQKTAESSWLLPVGGGAVEYVSDARAALAGKYAERRLELLRELAEKSDTRKRSVELFEAAVRSASAQGDAKVVFTDREAWDTYFTDRGEDPREAAIALHGSPEAYDRAAQTGEDIETPIDRWLSTVAPSPHHDALVFDSRLRPDDMSPREANEWLSSQEAHAAPLDEEPPQDGTQGEQPTGPDPLAAEQQRAREAMQAVADTATEQAAKAAQTLAAALSDSESQRVEYDAAVTAAQNEAETELVAQVAAQKQAEEDQVRREQVASIRAEVQQEIDTQPVYRALRYLRGELEIESFPAELRGKRLDRTAVESIVGADGMEPFKFTAVRDGGIDPDTLAELLGFKSGADLVRQLATLEPRGKAISRITAERVAQRLGEPMPAERIAQAAADAVHGPMRGRLLTLEVERLSRRVGRKATTESVVREAAQRHVARSPVGSLRPDRYHAAERRASRAAFKAAAVGDYAEAFRQKQREMRLFHLYRAARDQKAAAEAAIAYLRRMGEESARKRFGQAGERYLAQVDALLDRYSFRPTSARALARTQSLREWIAEQVEQGLTPAIPEELLDEARRVNWREASVEELLAVRDAVKNIEHLARVKRNLLLGKMKRDYEATVTGLVEGLQKNLPDRGRIKLSKTAGSLLDRLKRTRAKLDAAHVPVEELFLQFDGNDPNGPFASLFVHAMSDAAGEERQLSREFAKIISDAIVKMPASKRKRYQTKTVYIASIQQTLTMREVLAVALNMGNASNRRKLLKGYATELGQLIPWTEETLDEITSNMAREDWQLVQTIWTALDTKLWPLIAKQQREMTGIEPKKVEPVPFTVRLADGSTMNLAGGYYPVVYDRRFAPQKIAEASNDIAGQFTSGHVEWATPHGFTHSRVERFARPIDLDPFALPQHVSEVTHDLAYRRRLMDAYRLVTDSRVKTEIIRLMGEPYYDAIIERIKRTANARVYDSALVAATYGKVLEHSRNAMTAGALAFNAGVILNNLANVGPALDAVGPKWYAVGITSMMRHPREALEWIKAASPMMRERFESFDANVSREFDKMFGTSSTLDGLRRFGLSLAGYTDALHAWPLWYGAYRRGLAGGLEHDAAVRAADSAVTNALGDGRTFALSAVQDAKFLRYVNMFASWFLNAVYRQQRNILRGVAQEFRQGEYAAGAITFVWREFLLLVIPALLGDALMGKGPKGDESDDPDSFGGWAARSIARYLAGTILLLRDAVAAIDSGRDVRLSPVVTVLDQGVRTARKTGRAITGEGDWPEAFAQGAEATAWAFGVPGIVQTKRIGRAVEQDSENPMDYIGGPRR